MQLNIPAGHETGLFLPLSSLRSFNDSDVLLLFQTLLPPIKKIISNAGPVVLIFCSPAHRALI